MITPPKIGTYNDFKTGSIGNRANGLGKKDMSLKNTRKKKQPGREKWRIKALTGLKMFLLL